jgi:hypothetical protein
MASRVETYVSSPFARGKVIGLSMISGFRRDVVEISAVQGYYAASSGNRLPTFRDNVSVPSSRFKKSKYFLTLENGTDTLSRNVGKGLPVDAA